MGGRGDNPANGGIFLVHSHCIDRQPVIDDMGLALVLPTFGQKLFMNRLGAGFDLQSTKQDSVLAQPTRDAGIHRLPQRVKAIIQTWPRMHQLVCAAPFCNSQASGLIHCQHLYRRAEWVKMAVCGLLRVQIAGLRRLKFCRRHDKAAAHRIVCLCQIRISPFVKRPKD